MLKLELFLVISQSEKRKNNVFVDLNEQSRTCLISAMKRKRILKMSIF